MASLVKKRCLVTGLLFWDFLFLHESNKNAKFVTAECQNELINITEKIVQGKLLKGVKRADYYSVLADGTTDVYKANQFSIALRYFVDESLYEDFVEYVDVSGKKSRVLAVSLLEEGCGRDKMPTAFAG